MTLKLKHPAAILEGGPRHNWGYYLKDLQVLVATDEWAGRRFPYEPTGEFKPHPRAGGKVMSEVWRYAE
jgi:hypothetical protein